MLRHDLRFICSAASTLFLTACVHPSTVQEQTAGGTVAVRTPAVPEQAAFVILRGADTIGTERFTRTPDRLEAAFVTPSQGRFSFSASVAPDATVPRIDVQVYRAGSPADAAPSQRASAVFQGDSVVIEDAREGTTAHTARLATTRSAIPFINPSMSLVEQILRRARAVGGTTVDVPVFIAAAGGQTSPARVTFVGTDSATVLLGPAEFRVRVDGDGRLLGGGVPSQGLVIERLPAATP